MFWYPVFLDLTEKPVLVIGAGKVALRKALGLIEAGAKVTVIAPQFDPEFEALPVIRVERGFEDKDVEGFRLVFAATNAREVNRRAGEIAGRLGIPANIADAPAECGFIVPARTQCGGVQVAISTGGERPALSAALRKDLEQWLSTRLGDER